MSTRNPSIDSQAARQRIGRLGEDAAARHYEAEGYTVVARNVHMSHNEIDLIMENATHLAFVEVKTRHGVYGVRTRYGRPAAAVNHAKRVRTVEAAQAYLRTHPTSKQPRIDVVEVYVVRRSDGTDEVERVMVFHNAFGAR